MSRRLAVAGLVLGVAGAVAAAPAMGATPADSSALREAVTLAGVEGHMAELQAIADANDDTRASGTPGYDASLAYAEEQFDAAGYDTTVQNFLFNRFTELATPVFERTDTEPDVVYTANEDFVTMEYSGSGDVTGDLVPAGGILIPPGAEASSSASGCTAADYTPASETEPQVALIQRGTCTFAEKAQAAQAAGYDAAIIFNEGQEGRTDTLNGTLGSDTTATIPVIGISFALGEELYNADQAGDVVVHVVTSTLIERDVPTANLIAKSDEGRTDRQVVVGAHLDSVPEGPGINDNGSGTAGILETAIQIAELGIEPRNQLVFALWGAEEAGLIGSQFYVDSLTKREVKDIAVNLNFDMIGSPNFVRFVYDGDASDTDSLASTGSGVVEDVFADYFDSQDLPFEPTAFDGRSDYDAFISVGIPAGGLFTGAEGIKTEEQQAIYGGVAGEQYDPCYHAACDTFSSVFDFPLDLAALDGNGARGLDEMSDAVAHGTLTFAQSTSAVEGTDKGKANRNGGEAEFLGSHQRK